MTKKLLISLLLSLSVVLGFAQSENIKIKAKNQPLNLILLDLRKNYDFQFSYSDNNLSKYKISIDQEFQGKKEAVEFLIQGLPLKYKKAGDVFIIIPDKRKEEIREPEKPKTKIAGQIVEAGSYEPLPFSHILINNQQLVSDVMGSFNYTASADSSFHVQISHLGYYVFDTIVSRSTNSRFQLTPSSKDIAEITVQNNIIEKATLVGERSGNMKLNHNISRFIPGQGDNSVFNLMRLMPGIQAAGEQSNDLLIWGSYEGQSQITFDEFTIFGLKNYNDNISAVNPFLVKNIEIFKGAYEAKYGNRVGGIVNISGKNGNRQKPSASLNINPTTINGMLEFPLFRKSTFMMAYRQTYYNLYNKDDFNIFAPTRPYNKSASSDRISFDVDVYPDDYEFRDMNLKYTFHGDNGDVFYMSAYRGLDRFKIDIFTEIEREFKGNNNNWLVPFELTISNSEENIQRGVSANYTKMLKNGSSTIVFSHSDFSNSLLDDISSLNKRNNNELNINRANKTNQVFENILKIENRIALSNANEIQFGGGVIGNETNFLRVVNKKDSNTVDTISNSNNRAFLFIQDQFSVGSRLTLKTGLRMNIARSISKNIFEPRISANYKLTENWKVSGAWGIFNQFIYKVAEVDEFKNYTYNWTTSSETRPSLKAMHVTGGMNYFKNDLTINIEAYYKSTNNIVERVYNTLERNDKAVSKYFEYSGNAKTRGVDFYAKKDLGKHSIWASYTLSQSIQNLSNVLDINTGYVYAPHDQRHEFKVAGIANYKRFYLSANYVYGSGMQIIKEMFQDETDNVSYNRFDVALTYNFNTKFVQGETGLSILNVFDTQNLKYANIKNIEISKDAGDIRVYSDAVAFTPILFLKMTF